MQNCDSDLYYTESGVTAQVFFPGHKGWIDTNSLLLGLVLEKSNYHKVIAMLLVLFAT